MLAIGTAGERTMPRTIPLFEDEKPLVKKKTTWWGELWFFIRTFFLFGPH